MNLRGLTVLVMLLGSAQAVKADFSVSYPLVVRAGVSEVGVFGGQLSAGVSNRGADLGFTRNVALPPLGAVSVSSRVQYAWSGGYHVSSRASGTVGPVALNLAGSSFTTPLTTFDPLAAWTLTPTDLRPNGWNADVGLKYRASRNLVVGVGGEFGPQPHALAGIEYRRELTRTLPRAEGDDPEAPLETERVGTLTYRLGARAGVQVLAATAGLSYSKEDGRSFSLDSQWGPTIGGKPGYGLVGSATLPEVLGENSNLRFYAAYEPWRQAAAPLRAGVEATKEVGPGTFSLEVRGGQDLNGQTGFGVRAGYSVNIGAQTDSEE